MRILFASLPIALHHEAPLDLAYVSSWISAAAIPEPASTYAMAALLWLSLIAFAVLGGADFGAGIWDLLAFGRAAEKERGALIRAIGPIWEANEIWLIFLVTGLFTAFPIVFSTISIALFFPGVGAVIGTVLRGASFAYYSHFRAAAPVRAGWGRTFSIFSIIAPLCFGIIAGTVTSGHIHVRNGVIVLRRQDYIGLWLTPFPLACGVFAVAMCALLAAVYMVVEAHNQDDRELVALFRRRAFFSYAVTAVVGVLTGVLASADAHYVWKNLTSRALPLALATMLLGIATAVLLWLRRYMLARIAVAGTVAGIFATWALAQYPYLIPPDLSIYNAASPPSVMGPLLVSSLIGMAVLLPSLWFLLYLFKARRRPAPHPSTDEYLRTLPPASDSQAEEQQPTQSRATQAQARASVRLGQRLMHTIGRAALLLALGTAAAFVARWAEAGWTGLRHRWGLHDEHGNRSSRHHGEVS